MKDASISKRILRRLRWYRSRFQINNPIVGRVVEVLGNRVRMDGLTYSVATSQVTTGHKSTLAFGLHELDERELVRRWLPPDIPVIELGGGLGVVSCLTNRKLDDSRQHIVLEANPLMVPILMQNRDINRCKFLIINKAIAYDCDHVELNFSDEFVGSSVKKLGQHALGGLNGGAIAVPTTTIERVLTEFNFKEVGIVCDIEGAEADIILRELPTLGKRVKFVMAEMHPTILGAEVVEGLLDELKKCGFTLKQQLGDSVFFFRA